MFASKCRFVCRDVLAGVDLGSHLRLLLIFVDENKTALGALILKPNIARLCHGGKTLPRRFCVWQRWRRWNNEKRQSRATPRRSGTMRSIVFAPKMTEKMNRRKPRAIWHRPPPIPAYMLYIILIILILLASTGRKTLSPSINRYSSSPVTNTHTRKCAQSHTETHLVTYGM